MEIEDKGIILVRTSMTRRVCLDLTMPQNIMDTGPVTGTALDTYVNVGDVSALCDINSG